jgi:hypothetical protein
MELVVWKPETGKTGKSGMEVTTKVYPANVIPDR